MTTTLRPLFLSVLLFAACTGPDVDAPGGATDRPPSFQRTATANGYRFDVSTTGEGSLRQMKVRAEENGREIMVRRQEVDGAISEVIATDLNHDGNPELLIVVTSAGSGSYATLLGYHFTAQRWDTLALPALAGTTAAEGYQGHDRFEVRGDTLLRTFPVYRPGDPNVAPSGGTRTVRYVLGTNQVFHVVGVEDDGAVQAEHDVAYQCDSGRTLRVVYRGTDEARVSYRDQTYEVRLAISASGTRYTGAGVEWWTWGREGVLSDLASGARLEHCRER
jgi:membrane-bound inhibitor of C-type lysozyme